MLWTGEVMRSYALRGEQLKDIGEGVQDICKTMLGQV